MRRAVPQSAAVQTATYEVEFQKRQVPECASSQPPVGRVPRVARLLALAHRIDGMIRSGELRDWAEAARLVCFTRARMTQIASLLLLAPEIQEDILSLANLTRGPDPITERALRKVAAQAEWQHQEAPSLRRMSSASPALLVAGRSISIERRSGSRSRGFVQIHPRPSNRSRPE